MVGLPVTVCPHHESPRLGPVDLPVTVCPHHESLRLGPSRLASSPVLRRLAHPTDTHMLAGAKKREDIYRAFESIYPVLQTFRKGGECDGRGGFCVQGRIWAGGTGKGTGQQWGSESRELQNRCHSGKVHA